MLIIAVSHRIVFPHRQFHYQAGRLHSVNDEPAAVFAPDAQRSIIMGSQFDYIIHRAPTEVVGNCRLANLTGGLSNWYCSGDLHRDYGPATCGWRYASHWSSAPMPWWYKYHHGKQMASDGNTFMDDSPPYKINSRFHSRDGAVCSCAKIVAQGSCFIYRSAVADSYYTRVRMY
jgi:hypothetical protein